MCAINHWPLTLTMRPSASIMFSYYITSVALSISHFWGKIWTCCRWWRKSLPDWPEYPSTRCAVRSLVCVITGERRAGLVRMGTRKWLKQRENCSSWNLRGAAGIMIKDGYFVKHFYSTFTTCIPNTKKYLLKFIYRPIFLVRVPIQLVSFFYLFLQLWFILLVH